jgi:hypothetical protein
MGRRENKVESYLNSQIEKLGGITRKWVSPGHDGVPDRIIIIHGLIYFVEVKTPDGVMSPVQVREQERLYNAGAPVCVVYGAEGVDHFIREVVLVELDPTPTSIIH